jgi:hypothetical protein
MLQMLELRRLTGGPQAAAEAARQAAKTRKTLENRLEQVGACMHACVRFEPFSCQPGCALLGPAATLLGWQQLHFMQSLWKWLEQVG